MAVSSTLFKRGHIPWTKGIGHSEETKKKISLNSKMKGIKSELHPMWKGGIKACPICGGSKSRYAVNCRSCRIAGGVFKEENNKSWKGNKVGYIALHEWVARNLGKASKCSVPSCVYPRPYTQRPSKVMLAPKRYEWANLSGSYKRDFDDWASMCPSCHKLFDRKKLQYVRN